jgi:NAD(P)-dependent dehydrogenase (short-subunit alcohol dehydrogenase family)
LHLARWAAPKMTAEGGSLICTGNTSALRGKASFAGFAPTKAAQRILAESIAREMGPKGVHVAYIVIDAVIDLAWTRQRWKDKPDDFFIQPRAIADEAWHLAHRPGRSWPRSGRSGRTGRGARVRPRDSRLGRSCRRSSAIPA